MRQQKITLIAIGVMLTAVGCGRNDHSPDAPRRKNLDLTPQDTYPTKLFTQSEVDAVFTTSTEVRGDGKTYPTSLVPLTSSFAFSEASTEFKNTWGTFDFGNELKGYLHAGVSASIQSAQARVVSAFEALSTWKEMKDLDGNAIFTDTFTTDQKFSKIPDTVDGMAAATGEKRFARLITNISGVKVNVDTEVTLANSNGRVTMSFINVKPVAVPLVGTVIKERQMRVIIDMYPYKNGWLTYGGSAVTLEKFKDQYDKAFAQNIMTGLFNWIKEKSIIALN